MIKLGVSNIRRQFSERFVSGSFLCNVSIVMSGSVLGKSLGFALMPVLSRLYAPTDFGVLGTYNAILGIATTIVSLQYAQAIVLPKEKDYAAHLFVLAGLAVFITTGIFGLAAIMCPKLLLPNIYEVSGWLPPLLVLGVLLAGLNQVFEAWCVRIKAFNATATSQLYRSVTNSGTSVALGLLAAGPLGLVLGAILGQMFGSLNLLRMAANDFRLAFATITWERLKKLASEFRDFPIFSVPQNAMNALSQGLPVLILGYYYGRSTVGAFAFGMLILQVPMNVVLGPMRQVLFQKASETVNEGGDSYALYLKCTGALFAVALLPCLVLMVAAPEIFSSVFGREWYTSGEYSQWLALWVLFCFCNVPSTLFARIFRQQKNLFLWEILVLLLRFGTLIIGGLYFSALSTVIAFSLVGTALNAAYIFWIGFFILRQSR